MIYNLCDAATSESVQFVIIKNKWMSVFHGSVLLLICRSTLDLNSYSDNVDEIHDQ